MTKCTIPSCPYSTCDSCLACTRGCAAYSRCCLHCTSKQHGDTCRTRILRDTEEKVRLECTRLNNELAVVRAEVKAAMAISCPQDQVAKEEHRDEQNVAPADEGKATCDQESLLSITRDLREACDLLKEECIRAATEKALLTEQEPRDVSSQELARAHGSLLARLQRECLPALTECYNGTSFHYKEALDKICDALQLDPNCISRVVPVASTPPSKQLYRESLTTGVPGTPPKAVMEQWCERYKTRFPETVGDLRRVFKDAGQNNLEEFKTLWSTDQDTWEQFQELAHVQDHEAETGVREVGPTTVARELFPPKPRASSPEPDTRKCVVAPEEAEFHADDPTLDLASCDRTLVPRTPPTFTPFFDDGRREHEGARAEAMYAAYTQRPITRSRNANRLKTPLYVDKNRLDDFAPPTNAPVAVESREDMKKRTGGHDWIVVGVDTTTDSYQLTMSHQTQMFILERLRLLHLSPPLCPPVIICTKGRANMNPDEDSHHKRFLANEVFTSIVFLVVERSEAAAYEKLIHDVQQANRGYGRNHVLAVIDDGRGIAMSRQAGKMLIEAIFDMAYRKYDIPRPIWGDVIYGMLDDDINGFMLRDVDHNKNNPVHVRACDIFNYLVHLMRTDEKPVILSPVAPRTARFHNAKSSQYSDCTHRPTKRSEGLVCFRDSSQLRQVSFVRKRDRNLSSTEWSRLSEKKEIRKKDNSALHKADWLWLQFRLFQGEDFGICEQLALRSPDQTPLSFEAVRAECREVSLPSQAGTVDIRDSIDRASKRFSPDQLSDHTILDHILRA